MRGPKGGWWPVGQVGRGLGIGFKLSDLVQEGVCVGTVGKECADLPELGGVTRADPVGKPSRDFLREAGSNLPICMVSRGGSPVPSRVLPFS